MEVFEEYYSGPEDEGSEDEQDEDEGEDSEYEALMRPEERTPRNVTPVPGRVVPAPRRLRFRENDSSFGDPPEVEVVRPVEVNEINQHLEALHLGTPGQRRPNVSVEQVQSPRQLEFSVGGSRTTLEELMKKDHEMKLLKKAKLKNTTVKGKVREVVRYGEQMKISAESVDAHILAEFGLQGGRKLAKTLEGLIPTNKEELEQENFEAQWRTVGALSACQEVAEKGVGGILRHIFQGVKRNALIGAKEFLLYGPETSPEELEKALIRYDRKTEIIQSEKEKSHTANNKAPRPKDQPRRSERERKPYNRYERESVPSPRPDYRSDQRWKKGEERAGRNDQKYQTRGVGRYRDQSKPSARPNENTRRTGGYISPDKWEKMSADEQARVLAERGKSKTGTKIGQVRIESPQSTERRELVEPKEVKIKRKRSQRRNADEPRA